MSREVLSNREVGALLAVLLAPALVGIVVAGAAVVGGAGIISVLAAGLAATLGATAIGQGIIHKNKKFTGIIGGMALGSALTYGAVINVPQAPAPTENPLSPSTLHIESQGGSLSRDFKLPENATARANVDIKGEKPHTLTAAKAPGIQPL